MSSRTSIDTQLGALTGHDHQRHWLTWGQANLVGWMQLCKMDVSRNVVIGDLGPPAGASTRDAALAALSQLIERHEALQTLFDLPPEADPPYETLQERPRQQVRVGDAAAQIDAIAGIHSTTDLLSSLYDEYQGAGTARSDPGDHVPAFRVYERSDGRWGAVLIASHLVTEGAGLRVLGAEYEALLRGVSAAQLLPAAQPGELSAIEKSDAGIALNGRNLARMEAILRTLPPDQLVVPPQSRDVGSVASLTSEELHRSLDQLAVRWRIPKGGILMGLVALVVWHWNEWPQIAMRTLVRMPDIVRGKSYIGANGVTSLVSIGVEPGLDVRRYLQHAWSAVVAGYRASAHDPVAAHRMQAAIAADRDAQAIDGLVFVNYHPVADAFDPVLARGYAESIRTGRFERAWTGGNFYRTWVDAAAGSTATRLSLTGMAHEDLAARQGRALIALAQRLAEDDGQSTVRSTLRALE